MTTISNRTRKLLWGRSGNRCAFCRIVLFEEKSKNKGHLNLGVECHIVSSKEKGPRYIPNYGDYDDYNNLILLCHNHHRIIDERIESHSVEMLKNLKKHHETWVESNLDNAQEKDKEPNIIIYPRIHTGKELFNIINSVHGSRFDHDELKTKADVEEISNFFQNIKDWIDLFGMGLIEKKEEISLGFEFNDEIKKIETLGFFIFGGIERARLSNENPEETIYFDVATLLVLQKDNPTIINPEMAATLKPEEKQTTL